MLASVTLDQVPAIRGGGATSVSTDGLWRAPVATRMVRLSGEAGRDFERNEEFLFWSTEFPQGNLKFLDAQGDGNYGSYCSELIRPTEIVEIVG
ncbi:hypothetical protein [Streptomyces sp. NPDC058297]|uniref:hypothetical protein n=1 Tax=Streptomyces sp. NPDC058297 TaxID=3346433 RepID=UPI0036E8AC04